MSEGHLYVTLGADYERTKQILGSSRSFATNLDIQHSLDRTSNTAFPANVQVPTATGSRVASPTFPNCAPSETTPFAPNLCRFDNAPFDALQPD